MSECAKESGRYPFQANPRGGEGGKAILCEKPIGMEMADVDRLVQEVADFDRPIFVGFNRRFDTSHARLKELIDAGAVGKVEWW